MDRQTVRKFWNQTWGQTAALILRSRPLGWMDIAILLAAGGFLYGLVNLSGHVTGERRPEVPINLDDPFALVLYTFYSLMRGLVAYTLSLGFTLVYGYWAAKDHRTERLLVPLLDILQSIPVLSFLPGLVLGLTALFPTSNVGAELAAVIMIFTGQAWNMTFSYYHSLRSVPRDLSEVADVYRMNWWQRLTWLELPFATMGLVWNSMMSMAGGWFFLMICESFTLKGQPFGLPGLGSYMTVAVKSERYDAMVWGILAMAIMIIALDQFLWRPVVVWAQKFRFEEGGNQGPAMHSWFLDWLRHAHLVTWAGDAMHRLRRRREEARQKKQAAAVNTQIVDPHRTSTSSPTVMVDLSGSPAVAAATVDVSLPVSRTPHWAGALSLAAFVLLLGFMAFGCWMLIELIWEVRLVEWLEALAASGLTLLRVLASTALGTLWAVPAGLAIGLSPKLSRIMQPVVQLLASFPALMLFPIIIAVLYWSHVSLNVGSVLLMLLGTQWYILFNVVAGAMAIPADLREAAHSYRITGFRRFRTLYLPAIFPYLVTGWVTAAGGAWNASIVAEYVTYGGRTEQAWGLGAMINAATEAGNFPLLAASTLVMAMVVVLFNRTVWRACYRIAEEKYSLNK